MPTVQGGTSVKFKTIELQTAKRKVQKINVYGGLVKRLSRFPIARANRSRRTNSNSPERIIPVSMGVSGDSLDDLRSQIDTLQTILEGSGNLDVDIAQTGTYRRWVCEPGEVRISETDSPLGVTVEWEFFCDDPWGRDTTASDLINPNATLTASGVSTAVTFGGTAKDQYPIITLTLNSFTGAASNTITIQNPATLQQISITRTWTATDVIVIDLDNWSVKVNGVAVDYDGPLVNMAWAVGAGNIKVSDNFTTRNMTLDASNLSRYK